MELKGTILNCLCLIVLLLFCKTCASNIVLDERFLANTGEAFVFELPTNTHREQLHNDNSFKIFGSVSGKPQLPDWLKLYQDKQNNRVYLYGTGFSPDPVNIDLVIKSNKLYETNTDSVKIEFSNKQDLIVNQVELRLLGVDFTEFLERKSDLLSIFKEQLWKNSSSLHFTLLARPQDRNARLPLDPNEKEGVVIRIGSEQNFTSDLLQLQREIEPIKNRVPCPPRYKATSAEYLFRQKKFKIDWCSFRLIEKNSMALTGERTNLVLYVQSNESDEFLQRLNKETIVKVEQISYDQIVLNYLLIPLFLSVIQISGMSYLLHTDKDVLSTGISVV